MCIRDRSESIQHLKSRLNNHKLSIDMPKEVLFVPVDGKLIEQVIINLVDNAIKYTPEQSEINIKVYSCLLYTSYYIKCSTFGKFK